MALWGNLDAANNAPKQTDTSGYGGSTPQVTANGQVYYANTKLGSFITNAGIGVFGVTAAEQANSSSGGSTQSTGIPQHAGWVIRKVGMGPILTITANSGAVGANSVLVVRANSGFGNTGSNGLTSIVQANVYVIVNSAGYVQNSQIQIVNPGFYANTPVLTPASGNAVYTITMGGRANRVETETIVAMGSMTGDGENVF
jgi:hypothetical protein